MAPRGRDARLRFITGKGGVGKSTVAAALALAAVRRNPGGSVLAVDVLDAGMLRELITAGTMGLGPGDGIEPPTVLGLTTRDSLDQYVRRYLRIPIPPSSLGPVSRIFEFVSEAAPGVREILTVGKIGHEARHGGWDEVVVDSPASGHVVEMLAAPASLREVVGRGPLAHQTEWLDELLAASTTTVSIVTTPEELPTQETIELIGRLEEETDVVIDRVVINRCPPAIGSAGREEAADWADRPTAGRQDSGTAGPEGERDAALGPLIALAVDRDDRARVWIDRLGAVAAYRDLVVVEVADRPDDPVGAVLAALDVPGPAADLDGVR